MSEPPFPIFEYSLVIREQHLDTFGHVNNAVYLKLFEEARWEMITQNNFGLEQIQQGGLGPVVLELKIKFKKELRLRENITISTQGEFYKGKIGSLKQWILNSKGETSCEMDCIFGLFDLKQRKLVLPTKEWLAALGLAKS